MIHCIRLLKKFVWVSPWDVTKSPNEVCGQLNRGREGLSLIAWWKGPRGFPRSPWLFWKCPWDEQMAWAGSQGQTVSLTHGSKALRFPIIKSFPEGSVCQVSVWWDILSLINKPREAWCKGNAFAALVHKWGLCLSPGISTWLFLPNSYWTYLMMMVERIINTI